MSLRLPGLILAQLLAGGVVLGVDFWVTGTAGLIVALIAMGLGAFSWLWWRASQPDGWLTRARLKDAALRSAVTWWGVGAVAYAACATWIPGFASLTAGELAIGAPAIGLLVGFSVLAGVVCAGDTAALLVGGFAGESDGPQPEWGPVDRHIQKVRATRRR